MTMIPPSPTPPPDSRISKLLEDGEAEEGKNSSPTQYTTRESLHRLAHITFTFHFIVSNPKSYDKVRRPFWKSGGMSSVYIEWVKLNIVPSHIHGALAKNCTHAQTHSIILEMAKGFLLSRVCFSLFCFLHLRTSGFNFFSFFFLLRPPNGFFTHAAMATESSEESSEREFN